MSISVKVGNVSLKNPIILASGTCGFGRELAEYMDLSKLGALSSKGLTLLPRDGNQGVRVAETPSGMLNCVGLQNPGVDAFLSTELDYMVESGAGVVVNVAGHSNEDYISMVEKLDPYKDKIDALELNFSCPNVKEGCMVIGSSPKAIEALVSDLRKRTDLPLWVKLTPNVTSIAETAKGAEAGGADAIVAINTMLGMAIDIRTRRPLLHNNTGGLSQSACKRPLLFVRSRLQKSRSSHRLWQEDRHTAHEPLRYRDLRTLSPWTLSKFHENSYFCSVRPQKP